MMMWKYCMVLVAAAVMAAGCSGKAAYRYKQFYAMTEPVVNYDKHYEDSQLSFQFEISEKKVLVHIANVGPEEVELEWPNAAFIDSEGGKHTIVNEQNIFTNDMVKLKPSRLAPGGEETNVIVPADSQEELEQWTWYIKPFYNQVDDAALLNRDKAMKVVIPVKVAGEERKYFFQFTVTAVVPYSGLTLG